MSDFIPFNKIYRDEKEQNAVIKVLESDCWHGDGDVSKRVERQLCEWLGSRYTFLTTSCTHALEMAMMVLDIREGDEVIMPGFTFVSTANAVRLRGGKPVFADIRPSDLSIDPADIARKITPATRAVIPIHYAGVSADFDGIRNAIGSRSIPVVEDAAQAVGAYWNDRALGTAGDIGCFSFHDTKNITCGEGGAFLTQNEDFAQKAEWIREKGTNRTAFLRGEIDKYTWISPGSSYIPSDLLSAVLEAQIAKRDYILTSRKSVWETYRDYLLEAAGCGWITLPEIPSYARSNYHIFHFHVKDPADRDPLIRKFRDAGIGASFHYVPLHNAPYALEFLAEKVSLPQTERLADTLIRLPLYPDLAAMKNEVAERSLAVISDYYKSSSR